ncbi:tyrosine-type recombinase/integrase [Arthrobacter ginkgonis]|uniref:Tyrosine-type recombinase/integrase n=1 Tax=Arthrobacter ginkgonis TaxID=1630594 RepID=A0ABP7DFC6_9MICC
MAGHGREPLGVGELGKIKESKFTKIDAVTKKEVEWTRYDSSVGMPDGSVKRFRVSAPTETAAYRAMRAKAEELSSLGTSLSKKNPTVADAFTDWLEHREKQVKASDQKTIGGKTITRQTLEQYQHHAGIVIRLLGPVRLTALSVPLIEAKLESLITGGDELEGASTARLCKVVLKMALDHAVRLGYLKANPAASVVLTSPGVPEVKAPDRAALDLLRAMVKARFEAKGVPGPKPNRRVLQAIELMVATGARIGEVMALRWRDVDLKEPSVALTGTLIERGPLRRQSYGKSANSYAKFMVTPFVGTMLIEMKENTPFDRLDDPIFPTRTGKHAAPSAVRTSLRNIIEKSDVELPMHISPHSFRKAVATHLEATMGIEAASHQLRHADTRTTRRHYIARAEQVRDATPALVELSPTGP